MSAMNVGNLSNNTADCSVFTTRPYVIVALVSAGTASLSVLACIGVIILMIALKKYYFYVQRLILYLCLAALLNSISIALRFQEVADLISPDAPKSGPLSMLCVATAFIDQTTAWAETVAICCITINLLLTGVFKKNTDKLEGLYIFLIFIFPFTFNWVPFLHNTYGEAGAWCWIKGTDENCDAIQFGVYLRFILWYVPSYIIILAVILIYVFIIIWVTRQRRKWVGKFDPESEKQKEEWQKEVWPLMLYPFGFLILNIFPLINRIHDTIVDEPIYVLWILHAIFSPLQGGYIALVYTLDRGTLKRFKPQRIKAALFHKDAKISEYPAQRGITDSYSEPHETKYTTYPELTQARDYNSQQTGGRETGSTEKLN